jgi:hypothetical protein
MLSNEDQEADCMHTATDQLAFLFSFPLSNQPVIPSYDCKKGHRPISINSILD